MNFKNRVEVEEYLKKEYPISKGKYEILGDYADDLINDIKKIEKLKIKIKYTCPIQNKEVIEPLHLVLKRGYLASSIGLKKLYYKTDEYKNKLLKTKIERYSSYEKYLEKWKVNTTKTMKERYGVEWFLERGSHYKAIDEAMLKKYNVKHPIQNKNIRKKIENTMKENHGVNFFLKRGKHYDKIENKMVELYGVKNNFQIIQNSTGRVSKLEKGIIDFLIEELNLKEAEIFCYKTKQFRIENDDTWYNVDLYIPVKNLIIEINGDLWHCNPEIYDENYFHKGYNLSAKEIWQKDKIRLEFLRRNFEVHIIWENDWKRNKEETIKRVKEIYYGIKNN